MEGSRGRGRQEGREREKKSEPILDDHVKMDGLGRGHTGCGVLTRANVRCQKNVTLGARGLWHNAATTVRRRVAVLERGRAKEDTCPNQHQRKCLVRLPMMLYHDGRLCWITV